MKTTNNNNSEYRNMIELVKSHEVCDFFPSYSGLTRTTYDAEINEPFIEKMFGEYKPDLMTASTHKFGVSAEAPKEDKVAYFRTKALEWALDEYRMYAGQWNQIVYANLDWYNTDLYRENYRRKVGFVLDVLRNEIKTSRNKIINYFSSKEYGYDKKTCISIYYHVLSSVATGDISYVNEKWRG